MLGYHTKQQVEVMDRFLGITHYLIQLGIAVYVVVYVFIIAEGYVELEGSIGLLAVQAVGDVVAASNGAQTTRYFGADEITYPGLENGNLFVATKVETINQKRGVCEDKTMQCLTKEDCSMDVGAECTENKFCKEPSWCDNEGEQPEVYKLDTSDLRIWVKSAIQFVELDKGQVFINKVDEPVMFPANDFNTFTVRDLLTLCDPPVRFEEVSELGAAIEVQLSWMCNVDGSCTTKPRARRIDALLDEDKIGFRFSYPFYTGKDKRQESRMAGLRFYFRTVGTGYKVSLAAIIMKCSTGIALLGFAPIIADLMMINCFKLSKKYAARKYVYSEDLGDYFERLAALAEAGEVILDDDLQDAEDEQEDEEWRRRMDEEDE